jgi:EmrB/QacA subfamily drug resistance transporter
MLETNAMNRTQTAVLAVSVLASFLTPFMSSSINIALPAIGTEFAADAILLSWVATSYLLAAAMFLVPFGRLADIKGRRLVFISGLVIYTVASGLCAIIDSIYLLIVFRVLQGMGGSMIFGTGVAMLVSAFPPNQKGRVLGINVGAVYVGLSLGPSIGGVLTRNLGWRSIFAANVPVGLVAIVVTAVVLKKEWADAEGESFDIVGTVLYGGMLALIMYGLSDIYENGVITLAGFALLIIFVYWEVRVESPVLDVGLFGRNRTYSFSNLAALLNYAATFGVGFLLSLFLQYVTGLDPQEAGLILVSQPIFMAIFSPLAGRISDRIQPRIVASIGMGLTALSLAFLSMIGSDTTVLRIAANLVLLGFSLAFFSSPNANAVMSSVSKEFYGVASATLSTMRVVGQMTSMAIITVIFSIMIGSVQITPAVVPILIQSVQLLFAAFSVLCFIGMFASAVRGKVDREPDIAEMSKHEH